MKIACSVFIGNRLLPALSISTKQKYVKSTLALCKHPKSEEYCIIHFTNQNKSGTKYNVKGNVTQILTRFIHDGKATIQFKTPQHDFYIQCEAIQLKGFLLLLKRVLENKISPKELTCSSMSVTPVSSKHLAPKKLVIKSRSEFPAKGFPRTLESLYINDVKLCSMHRGVLQLTKLKVLDLSQNCIERLPEELNVLHLQELNLASNQMNKSSPRQWLWMSGNLSRSLAVLNLESNDLAYLPDDLVKLHKLVNLNVNCNKLTHLPAGIGNLRHLKILIASNNELSALPGSIKRCNLDLINLFNNDLVDRENNCPVSIPKTFPVASLKDTAAKQVLDLKLQYCAATIPYTLVHYLDRAQYCVCGKACFEVFIRAQEVLSIANLAQEFVMSPFSPCATVDCYFCSLKCFRTSHFARQRMPVI